MIEKIPKVIVVICMMIVTTVCSFAQHTVTIKALPVVNTGSDLVLKPGQASVQPVVTTDDPGPGQTYTYNWSGPSGFSSLTKQPVLSVLGTYTLQATNTWGCSNQDQLLVRTLLPTDTFMTVIPNMCFGYDTLMLYSYTSYPGEGSFSGTNVINGNAFVPKTTGLNKVYWTLGSVTDSATFMVYALPNTKVFRDTITRCSGDSVWISVLGTADTYNWSLLSNPTVSLSNQSLYHIKMPSSSTPYLFTGTANYPGLTCSIKDTLAVIPVPVVADFLDTIDHNRVYFYGIPGAQTYAWEFGDKKFSKDWQQDPVFTYKANGYFNVKLTITTMCSSQKYSVTKSIFIADLLYIDDGIQDISQSDIKVYPNPVVDYVQIQGVREFNQLQIVDIHGKLVDIKQFDKYQDFYYFDLSDYKTGTYIFCFLDAKGNIYTTRVIKQ